MHFEIPKLCNVKIYNNLIILHYIFYITYYYIDIFFNRHTRVVIINFSFFDQNNKSKKSLNYYKFNKKTNHSFCVIKNRLCKNLNIILTTLTNIV